MMEQIKLNGQVYTQETLAAFIQTELPIETWKQEIYDFLGQWFNSNVTITVNTSGSTGKPKSIQLSKSAMRHSARITNNYFKLNADSTAMLCMPATFIAGKMMLVRAIVGGYNLLLVEPSATPLIHVTQAIDFTAFTAYQFEHSIMHIQLHKIKHLLIGGSSINLQTQAFIETITTNCYESYGMTETCSHIAIRPLNGTQKSISFQTLEGIKIRTNEHNCLCIEAPHLLHTEITTNDVVEIINETQFRWIGRRDSIINSGGIKIQPELVEKKLETYIDQPFFISSKPDKALGQKLILLIESNRLTPKNEEKLKLAIQTQLNRYEQPKEIIYLPQFCYSQTNKILKTETLNSIINNEHQPEN